MVQKADSKNSKYPIQSLAVIICFQAIYGIYLFLAIIPATILFEHWFHPTYIPQNSEAIPTAFLQYVVEVCIIMLFVFVLYIPINVLFNYLIYRRETLIIKELKPIHDYLVSDEYLPSARENWEFMKFYSLLGKYHNQSFILIPDSERAKLTISKDVDEFIQHYMSMVPALKNLDRKRKLDDILK